MLRRIHLGRLLCATSTSSSSSSSLKANNNNSKSGSVEESLPNLLHDYRAAISSMSDATDTIWTSATPTDAQLGNCRAAQVRVENLEESVAKLKCQLGQREFDRRVQNCQDLYDLAARRDEKLVVGTAQQVWDEELSLSPFAVARRVQRQMKFVWNDVVGIASVVAFVFVACFLVDRWLTCEIEAAKMLLSLRS